MASIIINDYVVNKRVKLVFLPEDIEVIDSQWHDTDPVLQHLQQTEFFRGRERWCDLTPAHFRILVARNLQSVSFLAEEDRIDDGNPVVSSLNFLIGGLLRCIEETCECHVELLRLNRVGDLEVAVEFEAALRMEAPLPSPPKKFDPFSVVVVDRPEE